MAIVQGAWNKVLSPGLAKAFATSFYLTDELIEDDAYDWIRPQSNVRELHVFDLGDGMLVPCQMVRDLFGE